VTRPRFDGDVWYRVAFDAPAGSRPDDILALYVERVCSTLDVHLNGHRVHAGGRLTEPLSVNCRHPQLVELPAALLRPSGNVLELHVAGHALAHVTSRGFAAGLSALRVGPAAALADLHAARQFWSVTWLQGTGLMLIVLGCGMLALGWQNPHEVYFGYFGALVVGWAMLSTLLWARDVPWHHSATGYVLGVGLATLVGLGVQFLLSYAGLRSRAIESALVVQWLLMPSSLVLAGEARVFSIVSVWYAVFAAEIMLASAIYLVYTHRDRRQDFWAMLGVLSVAAAAILLELDAQHDLFSLPFDLPVEPLPIILPLLFLFIGARLFLMFARALPAAEAGRTALARRVRELTTEFEGNFSQLAELRVEQVTERERKRIAADLHDDLGAKLLTIVHTSESERITALAREALEDMRLSVKGLIGKPMRLADALADWRAETVARLGQAKIEVDWRSPAEESEHLLPSRGFVQTTRILREAVSNVVKHSRATRCNVRCSITDGHLAMTIQDNGRGIPLELDGKLDRGLGMSSMKRRAKQMRGQCLVQSGPGYGTVIALTVPL
jgi:signal transduction histidine kinase